MIKVNSEEELLKSFREIDRDQVQIPPDFKFPLAVRDYLSWVEPSGHRVFLIFENQGTGNPMGVVFRRPNGPPLTPASMCQWCHTVRTGNAVTLLTAAMSESRTIGLYLCSRLNCREHTLAPPGAHDFNEGLSAQERINGVVRRMGAFATGNLF
jgi:hypothetical protein